MMLDLGLCLLSSKVCQLAMPFSISQILPISSFSCVLDMHYGDNFCRLFKTDQEKPLLKSCNIAFNAAAQPGRLALHACNQTFKLVL